MTTAVIMQPYYIPYRVYFHWLYRADFFVFFDDVQYVRRSWHNRNQIRTSNGKIWLTVPVHSRNLYRQKIKDVRIDNSFDWGRKHWKSICLSYGKAKYFDTQMQQFAEIYHRNWEWLLDLNVELIMLCARLLDIRHVTYLYSSQFGIQEENPTKRLIEICKRLNVTRYISGPAAKTYMDEDAWRGAGILLEWHEAEYPTYPQLHYPFDPLVSIIDLLLNCGTDASKYVYGPKVTLVSPFEDDK